VIPSGTSRRSATVTWCGEHLKVLSQAGLIRGKKIRQWVFYQRNEDRIAELKESLSGDW
jgi:DNA-binding transcriptional ArsR family regulator